MQTKVGQWSNVRGQSLEIKDGVRRDVVHADWEKIMIIAIVYYHDAAAMQT